ncbi:CoA-disulfide reductase [Pontibacillus yanchengensis]|uniref:CoA-disulfide reductase n=2 Tax=Pontibacillus yanchengensis TaxID=462910 RepID=A0ACC7VBU2_9BACI|nr:CoA-disulfide reductase [Pontibacillus yanchengensis]MYL35390.1 CoA-disulfide reductase [Pontibacillus yanchengensis]MYL52421.1 CoA-disulfide reductase [Pontibacillus yanchengensis]
MKFVIIGGDAAGMSAAMQIVRNSSGNEITTLEKGTIYSYGQCGLPYTFTNQVESTDDLIARTPETFKNKYGIDTKILHEVTRVDYEEKVVHGTNLKTNESFQESYDRLLVATGASPVFPPWDGKDLEGIFTLKTIPDAQDIKAFLGKDIENITIIGGGYIGLEMAESMAEIGKNVQIIERGNQLAKIFDEEMAELIHDEGKNQNLTLTFEESVEGFKGTNQVEAVVTNKGEHKTDLVLVAVGVAPNTSFMNGTGAYKTYNDALIVNHYMQTNIKDIYAAGDCATQYHRIKEKDDYIPLGTHANKQGQIAGVNMIDQPRTFKGVVGSSIIKFFSLTLGRTGLSEKEAQSLSIPYETITIQSTHAAGYYSKEDKMTLKLVFNKESRLLLGGQIIGGAGVDKRIDVLATALYHQMKVDELQDLDLSYAPPYNGVWDPLQQAARKT